MPECSWNQFEAAQHQARIEREVQATTFGRLSPPHTLKRIFVEAVKEVQREVNILKSTHSQHTMMECPKCHRTVKAVNGRILSHRAKQKANGFGMGEFCEYNNGGWQ